MIHHCSLSDKQISSDLIAFGNEKMLSDMYDDESVADKTTSLNMQRHKATQNVDLKNVSLS